LCISIFFPETVRQLYGVANSRIVWLAETPGDDCIPPTALSQLRGTITNFAETRGRETVVLLDGLERLVTRNGFAHALKWVEELTEIVARTSAIVLVPFSPETAERRELANFERTLRSFDGGTLTEELAAAEMSRILMSEE
jgi:hypothetical protein